MWIRFYPNWKMNINSKNGTKRSFPFETKASIHLPQQGEWIYGAKSLKERIYYMNSCLSPFIDED